MAAATRQIKIDLVASKDNGDTQTTAETLVYECAHCGRTYDDADQCLSEDCPSLTPH
jgi:hypothetical protein